MAFAMFGTFRPKWFSAVVSVPPVGFVPRNAIIMLGSLTIVKVPLVETTPPNCSTHN